ncbi:RNA polymerase sigma factor [Sphingobacterium sp. HMA12]|uniref:RNA polymerase sigma factor n=1 Tax=Sphingobacterium sp. HMA12 TaxID=2050894 RepID=UPI001315988A|nr:sigma-70 family RNA polymerase sigma factor [Sphingobacterium sp. HMA12]
MEAIAQKQVRTGGLQGVLDHDTFNLVYTTYQGTLYKKFMFLLNFQETAEDILQDVFLKTWQLRDTIKTEKSLKSYLFQIGRNLIMDHYRRQKREHGFTLIYRDFVNAVDQIDVECIFHEDKFSKLEGIINKLPPRRRQVFELCKLERRTYEEVSELLHISPSTISDHIVKAMQFIKVHWN